MSKAWTEGCLLPLFTVSILALGDGNAILRNMRCTWVFPLAMALTASHCQPGTPPLLSEPIDPSPLPVGLPCPDYPHLRLVPVATPDQLVRALETAEPGDLIELADGSYRGDLVISISGTSSAPITLCGPRTAVIHNSRDQLDLRGNWWVIRGVTVTGGYVGLKVTNGNDNLIDSVLIEHVANIGLALGGTSSRNRVRQTTVRYTGEVSPQYGEAFYVGNGSTGADPANDNVLDSNTVGPGVTAEHFDIKHGTSGNIIRGNVSDAVGFQYRPPSIGQATTALYITGGTGTVFLNNVVRNIPREEVNGFQSWQGSQTSFHGNTVAGLLGFGFRVDGGTANVVGCDNVVVGAADGFANVRCR
jgi:hypothetical protein